MTGNGLIHASGIRVVLNAPNDAMNIPASGGPLAYLLFVTDDGEETPIVPEYQPQGLDTPAGPLSGAKITVPINAAIAASLADYVPTAQVDTEPTNDTIVQRSGDGTVYVRVYTVKDGGDDRGLMYYYEAGDAFKLNSPTNIEISAASGSILLECQSFAVYDGVPAAKGSLSASSPTLAVDLLNYLAARGFVTADP